MIYICIVRHRNQRDANNHEYQCETGQQDSQRYFIRCFFPGSAFHQSNHLVEEALTLLLGYQYLYLIRKHLRTTGYRTLISTRLTDYRGRFACDGTFINGSQSFYNLTVSRNRITGFANKVITFLQACATDIADFAINQDFSGSLLTRLAQAVGLGLTTSLGNGLSEVGEQQSNKENDEHQEVVPECSIFRSPQRENADYQHHQRHKLHRKHNRILNHHPWIQLHE